MFDLIEPKEILRGHIKNYIIVETNSYVYFLPMELVFPFGNATLVFHYCSPSKFQTKNSNEYIEPNLVICGQQTNYYDLSLSGMTGMILIVFKPHGVKSFFNFSAIELLNKNLSLSDLIKNEAI